ncbi:hypothetical protein SORBI_3006G018701 [Sorghum bicolor]|uniref:Myb-like domain-containing protein n=1 Tax=Sorghum bicolor TaxID=4558 RepID=A0A1Z5RBN4_SORBI|nr:hypothetical protein SORBI_3006G018701 [Sorghum bicolor]
MDAERKGTQLMRRRVVPPTGGQPTRVLFPDAAEVEVVDELSGTMDSGAYFADLITKGHGLAGQSENPPPPQEVVAQDEVQTIGKRNQRRTKNFTVEEDEQLVKAWLNVSLDRVKGVDQPHTTYWERIHAYFHVHKDFSSDRTQGSLMNRWSGIQHDVNLFAGCLSKTECENQSGVSIDDKVW